MGRKPDPVCVFNLRHITIMADEDRVKGMGEAAEQAQKGLALFEKQAVETIKVKEEHEKTLTGKDNKKERTAVGKEISAMKADPKYVDACKIGKDLPPPNGNFAVTKESAKAAEAAPEQVKDEKKDEKKKDDKPKKKAESAGITPDKRKELDKLKNDIIARKAELKAAGKSGGECNKDEQVVAWVARMQELKIKEDPTLADGDKKKDDKKKEKVNQSAEKLALQTKIEEYRMQLINEFQYSAKDIKADPDMMEMQKQLAKMK